MGMILTQTDGAAACGPRVGCSGQPLGLSAQSRQMTVGGVAGVVSSVVTIAAPNPAAAVMFQSGGGWPGLTSWASGNWVIRLNVNVGNSRLNWVGSHVCRFSQSCVSLATVGSLTGQSVSLKTTGVKTMTVPGVSQSSSVTDSIYIVLIIDNTLSIGSQTFEFIPDQVIDAPLSSGIAIARRRLENS